MDNLQKYFNKEYQKEYDDTAFLSDEELAQMNPATDLDREIHGYLDEREIENLIAEKQKKIVSCQEDIEYLDKVISDRRIASSTKTESHHNIMENYIAIRRLEEEIRELEQKLSEGHGRSR